MKDNYDFSKGKRGAVVKSPNKVRTSIRFDPRVLEWFKNKVKNQGGGNYQSLMNQVLLEYVMRDGESLEETLRRILREELVALTSNNKQNIVIAPKKPQHPDNHRSATR